MKSFPVEQFLNLAKQEGRSEAFIQACLKYVEKLEKRGYPIIFSLPHLAIMMGVQSNYIKALIGENEEYNFKFEANEGYKTKKYNHFFIKKKKRGYREIMAPHKDLKYIQKWLLSNIISKFPLRDSCKGFRTGISIKENALTHVNARVILKVDLLKFYDTITEKRVYGVFQKMGYSKNLSYSLAKLCTTQHHERYWENFSYNEKRILSKLFDERPSILPQGAPTSPYIANIVATNMDSRFEKLSVKMNFSYSRYADDLTFSIHEKGKLPSLRLIEKIISEENFYINKEKITYMYKGSKQYVTGLTVSNGVHTSKKYRKEIARHIYFCRKYGVKQHLSRNRDKFPSYNSIKFHDWLYGHICFIHSIDDKASEKILCDFNKINWFL
ncbi:reverse transcriptase family protein [Myroides sp. DW712]|uniref:reverse transcriptase family protein n=1 Tax=Myroides sp. DW712 TaxID=3389800 RepID=UPI00397C6467